MIVYHRTSTDNAESIRTNGFRDTTDNYGTRHEYTGVWVSDTPLDENEGAFGDALLTIELAGETPESMERFRWTHHGPVGYREYLMPAQVLNGCMRIVNVDILQSKPDWAP